VDTEPSRSSTWRCASRCRFSGAPSGVSSFARAIACPSRNANSPPESRLAATLRGARCLTYAVLAHEGPLVLLASPGCHPGEAVWPRWRASGDRGKSPAQTAIDRLAPCSPAGAESDAKRPAALRIRVALPRSITHPKNRYRRTSIDAAGVSSGVGAWQVPPPVLIEPVPKEARTKGCAPQLFSNALDPHAAFGSTRYS
jgi:hypothetical protein